MKSGRRRQPTLASVDTYSCRAESCNAVNEYVDRKTILHVSPGFAKLNCAYMAVPSSLIVTSFMGRREETCIPPGQHHGGALQYLEPEALVSAKTSGMEPTEQT